ERIHVIERNELDVFQLRVNADVLFGNSQIVRGRQSFLFRTVLRISLNVHSEYFAGNRGDDFVGGDGAITTDRVAAHRERSGIAHIGILSYRQGKLMLDA